MRRLIRRLRSERGASAMLFGLLLIPLLGFGGIAVDVAALYAEKAQLQNGADAVALEIAIACGKDEAGTGCAAVDPGGLAGGNAIDGVAVIGDVDIDRVVDEVRVTTNSEDLGVRHPLAAMIPGIGETTVVTAIGAAEWGIPVRGTTLALAIGYCEFLDSPPMEGVATPTKILIEYETVTRHSCPGAFAPGGFGWLPSPDCAAEIDIEDPWVLSEPGSSPSGSGCTDTYMATLLGETIFVPIYDEFRGTGRGAEFHISQFAAFKLTGFKVSGGSAYTDPGAPRCVGSCRGLQGYFMKYVSVSDAFELGSGGGSGTGAGVAQLILP